MLRNDGIALPNVSVMSAKACPVIVGANPVDAVPVALGIEKSLVHADLYTLGLCFISRRL